MDKLNSLPESSEKSEVYLFYHLWDGDFPIKGEKFTSVEEAIDYLATRFVKSYASIVSKEAKVLLSISGEISLIPE